MLVLVTTSYKFHEKQKLDKCCIIVFVITAPQSIIGTVLIGIRRIKMGRVPQQFTRAALKLSDV